MPYSKFTLQQVMQDFNLTIVEVSSFLPQAESLAPSAPIAEFIDRYFDLALALNTEKARSELIICPTLLAVKEAMQGEISLFSGEDFTVDPDKGLNGICDYILSLSPEQLFIQAPVIMIVEAKKEDLKGGLGQCVAAMVAAQKFNQAKQNAIPVIYGAITTGSLWRFLKLKEQQVTIGIRELPVPPLEKIVGTLVHFISQRP
jgi:hypothetical protein